MSRFSESGEKLPVICDWCKTRIPPGGQSALGDLSCQLLNVRLLRRGDKITIADCHIRYSDCCARYTRADSGIEHGHIVGCHNRSDEFNRVGKYLKNTTLAPEYAEFVEDDA